MRGPELLKTEDVIIIMKKALSLIMIAVVFISAGCFAVNRQNIKQPTRYQSYKEIPGVTQEDIDKLEDLLAKKPQLVYGMCASTEAFVRGDSSVGGFTDLFCNRMSELFGFSFKRYTCVWNELNEKIVSKEIDLSGDFTVTPERLQKFIMTDAIVQRTVKVFTDINSDSLSVISKTRPVRCAFLSGSTTYPIVAESWNIPFEPVFIHNQSSVPDLLLNDEIDAFIEEGVLEAGYDSYDFINAEEYYPLTYSPVSLTTGNSELKPLIDIMQKYLKNGGYYELTELYNQGYKEYLKYKLSMHLTDEEKNYIEKHNTADTAIPAACETDNYPSSFYNKKENEFQGVAIDVLDQVSALTGLSFKTGNGPDAPWSDLFEGLENGEYSIVTELIRTNNRENRFLWAEEPCYTDSYAMISRADYPDVDINQILFADVGLIKDSAYADVFLEWFPKSENMKIYDGNENAFAALEKGEVDLLMATQNLLLHLTNYLEKPGFKANIVFNYSTSSFFGLNKDEKILCSIINKAQRYIDTKAIAEHWKRKVFDYQSKMAKDMIPYFITFVAVLIMALFVVFFLFVKNKRISKNLERLVADRTNELELQTSTLSTMFESIPDIVFCKDLNFRFTRCNRQFEKHFGCLEQNIVGKDDESGLGIPADTAELFREADRSVIRGGQIIAVEECIPSVDGSMPLFETIKTPLMQNGESIGIMGISRDITRRKAAEETLKLTLDNLNTCIYISEIETGKILFMNKTMTEVFDCEDFDGKTCWEVLQNGTTDRCGVCPISKLQESGDKCYIWEDLSPFTGKHYKITDCLIKWHDGRLVHLQHLVDITDSVKLQQDLENASKAKGDFLSRMSHEIRTPLNAVIGMNNISMNTNDVAKMHYCHEKIDNASKHLLGVINDILDMSKIEADKFELSYSEFDFEKALMNITNVINFRAEEKSQKLVVNIGDDVPAFILGDELRLAQVITNLLSNAVKFTPEYGTITLNAEKTDDTDDEVTLQINVTDTGIGISEEQKSRLFTSFEQADGSISRKFGGTGLGLAISKRIIELMGGEIWIESEIGKGSKFIFTIKVKSGRENKCAGLSSETDSENIHLPEVNECSGIESVKTENHAYDIKINRDYSGHTILIAEDVEINQEIITAVLEETGVSIDFADNGQLAVAMFNANPGKYSLIMMDIHMPELDGFEATSAIRALESEWAKDIPIVAMTANVFKEDIENCLSAGMNDHVGKPIDANDLFAKLGKYLFH